MTLLHLGHLVLGHRGVAADPEPLQFQIVKGADVLDIDIGADVQMAQVLALRQGAHVADLGIARLQIHQVRAGGEGSQVADGGIAAIKLAQILHFAQYLQVADRRT